MAKIVFSFFLTIFLFFVTSWVVSYEKISLVDNDNEQSLEISTRNAVTNSVNLGVLRTSEKISLNQNAQEEILIRQYADSVGFYRGDRTLNIYKFDVGGGSPLMATEAFANIQGESAITKDINQETRSRTIQIIEARKTIR
ncbi:hypothetical protein QK289_15520 [Exiguobacterium antarcticum]|uniref:Uncharacterized protein n=1 Tax=Exiguobacterium antarcticum TaxID=132920 RepID=A0ABT6R644_9BACL|nr:hypothetical protein [Exiguobacterium antarcticum]MDI3236424.1 hypothetical protein [Exiguobacterium antarcticum]